MTVRGESNSERPQLLSLLFTVNWTTINQTAPQQTTAHCWSGQKNKLTLRHEGNTARANLRKRYDNTQPTHQTGDIIIIHCSSLGLTVTCWTRRCPRYSRIESRPAQDGSTGRTDRWCGPGNPVGGGVGGGGIKMKCLSQTDWQYK